MKTVFLRCAMTISRNKSMLFRRLFRISKQHSLKRIPRLGLLNIHLQSRKHTQQPDPRLTFIPDLVQGSTPLTESTSSSTHLMLNNSRQTKICKNNKSHQNKMHPNQLKLQSLLEQQHQHHHLQQRY